MLTYAIQTFQFPDDISRDDACHVIKQSVFYGRPFKYSKKIRIQHQKITKMVKPHQTQLTKSVFCVSTDLDAIRLIHDTSPDASRFRRDESRKRGTRRHYEKE